MGPRHCKANECENRRAKDRWGRCATKLCGLQFDGITEDDFIPYLTRFGTRYMGVDICLDHTVHHTSQLLDGGFVYVDWDTGKRRWMPDEPYPDLQVIVANGMTIRESDVSDYAAVVELPFHYKNSLLSADNREFFQYSISAFGTRLTPPELPTWLMKEGGYVILCDGHNMGPENGGGLRQVVHDTKRRALVEKIAASSAIAPLTEPDKTMWERATEEHARYEQGYSGVFDLEADPLTSVDEDAVYRFLPPPLRWKMHLLLTRLSRRKQPLIRKSEVKKLPD